jgi:hypothetical protein
MIIPLLSVIVLSSGNTGGFTRETNWEAGTSFLELELPKARHPLSGPFVHDERFFLAVSLDVDVRGLQAHHQRYGASIQFACRDDYFLLLRHSGATK